MGCELFTNLEVEKAIIENGAATGIRLADGSEIAARKLVVSTLSPHQLIFDLIGEQGATALYGSYLAGAAATKLSGDKLRELFGG